jgi:hypothetical protein
MCSVKDVELTVLISLGHGLVVIIGVTLQRLFIFSNSLLKMA